MFIQTAFSFSNAVQRWVCRFSGLRLVALRWFVVFMASGPCVASASSYFFRSAVPPRWHRAFSQLAPVAKLRLSVLASGSNISVKPTRIAPSSYRARLPHCDAALLRPCFLKRHSISQALFSAGFVVSLGFAWWRYAGLCFFWPMALV